MLPISFFLSLLVFFTQPHTFLPPQKLRCCRSMVHKLLVNRSKSSSEKSTGLSRELCRLGDRQASPPKKVRSGRVEEDDDAEEEAGGGAEDEEAEEESRCSGNAGCTRPPSSGVGCALSPLSAA